MINHSWNVLWATALTGAPANAIANKIREQHQLILANSLKKARQVLSKHDINMIVCDKIIGHESSLDLLRESRITHPYIVRILRGNLNLQEVTESINEAAVYQFIPENWLPEQILLLIKRAIESYEMSSIHRHLIHELKLSSEVVLNLNLGVQKKLEEIYHFDRLVFKSSCMQDVCDIARQVAATDIPVIIEGESGTGKELFAHAIHHNSKRKNQIIFSQNCGGISDQMLHSELFGHKKGAFTGASGNRKGLFMASNGGTIFLDEISEASLNTQVNLLRLLQEGEVKPLGCDQVEYTDIRIISATNKPLEPLVEQQAFRKDLFFRLSAVKLKIPPLRERPEDIQLLTNLFIEKYNIKFQKKVSGISPSLYKKFTSYQWPGNVRELENEISYMVALTQGGEVLSDKHLVSQHIVDAQPIYDPITTPVNATIPINPSTGNHLSESVAALEKVLIEKSLTKHYWNQSKVAKELGLSRMGLANKLKRYNLRKTTSH